MAANPQYRKYLLRSNYNMTIEEYQDLLIKQNHGCGICSNTVPGGTYHFFPVDHCHNTNKVRGLLCINCNFGLGRVKDNITTLRSMIDYCNMWSTFSWEWDMNDAPRKKVFQIGPQDLKKCKLCGLWLCAGVFFNTTMKRGKPAYNAECRKCRPFVRRERRAGKSHRGLWISEQERIWLLRNNTFLKDFGISVDDYERIYAIQGGACFICRDSHNILNVDHDHKTNKIRGLLCTPCNLGLGFFKEDIKMMNNAITYLGGSF